MKKYLIPLFLVVPPTAAPLATTVTCSETVWKLGQTISRIEAVPAHFNNPGGLTSREGLQRFSSWAKGEQAMLKLIHWYVRNRHSLETMFKKWAPDSVPGHYAFLVSQQTGIARTVPLLEVCE